MYRAAIALLGRRLPLPNTLYQLGFTTPRMSACVLHATMFIPHLMYVGSEDGGGSSFFHIVWWGLGMGVRVRACVHVCVCVCVNVCCSVRV